jgi:hypothetical protein
MKALHCRISQGARPGTGSSRIYHGPRKANRPTSAGPPLERMLPRVSRRALRLLLLVCALPLLWLLTHSFLDLGLGFLFLSPAFLLALPLLAGRYVGAERLSGVATRVRAVRPARLRLARRPWLRVPPRGGLLIAASLAVRPPPPPVPSQ